MSGHKAELLALKAARIAREPDIDGRALAKALGVSSAREAWRLAAVGRSIEAIRNAALTASEMLLLRSVAACERAAIARGETRSPTAPDVSWRARKSAGWAASVAAKRLGHYRKGEPEDGRSGTGLGFIVHRRNGHIWLTAAGWALVSAMEARV